MSTKYGFGIKIDGATDRDDWNRSVVTDLGKAYGDKDAYEADVVKTLDTIQPNLVGKLILHLIDRTDKDLVIAPYTDQTSINLNVKGYVDTCNSQTTPDSPVDGHAEHRYWYTNSDGGKGDREQTSDVWGSGKGSDVHIRFTPRLYSNPGGPKSPCDNGGVYGKRTEQILFHEMIHALRQMSGHDLGFPSEDQLRNYDNDEEFLVIVVTNVFISAFGSSFNTSLRADHHGHKPLTPPENTSKGFLGNDENLDTLMTYYNEEFLLYQYLALVPDSVAQFNPFRELVQNGAAYGHAEVQPFYQPVVNGWNNWVGSVRNFGK